MERIVLSNGVRVISERVKGALSVVFGVWLDGRLALRGAQRGAEPRT